MDVFSTAIGFLIGTITGASGSYLGNKYTDIRHQQEKTKAKKDQWRIIENKYPNIISEMVDDFSTPEYKSVRKFFVKNSKLIVSASEFCFEYHTDIHADLNSAMLYFQDLDLVEDITPRNCPMYRFKEDFAEYLISKTIIK